MNIWFWITIVGMAIAFAWIIWYRNRGPKYVPTLKRVLEISADERNLRIGPLGTRFWVEDGATLPGAVINAIESGLTDAFERAGCVGYPRQRSHADHNVAILRSHENDSQGFPAYRLPAGPYTGTEFDKGGYILVAGEMVAAGNPYGNWIAIPEHTSFQTEHARTIADYETEHVLLAWNDGDEFERTKIHGQGTGHPIIPSCPGEFRPRGLAEIGLVSGRGGDYCALLTK